MQSVQSAELLWPVSLGSERATCPRLRLTLQMHCEYLELFFCVVLSFLQSFDRLVNNAGRLCNDNKLGGKAGTHNNNMLTHFVFYRSPHITFSCSRSLAHFNSDYIYTLTVFSLFFLILSLLYLQFTPLLLPCL